MLRLFIVIVHDESAWISSVFRVMQNRLLLHQVVARPRLVQTASLFDLERHFARIRYQINLGIMCVTGSAKLIINRRANDHACYWCITSKVLRSEEHTSELQSLMRISYAVCCLKKKHNINTYNKQKTYQHK